MRSVFDISVGRRRWRVLPWIALRCAAVSMVVVLVALFAVDRIALPLLEQRGLTAGDDWRRHNEIVIAEHRKKDTSEPLGESVPVPNRFGVRSWTGHPVAKQKTTTCRILVMGDSFVWGSAYLTLNHMWWRQLENELLSRGYDVEVIAAGQPGAATRDQLTVARRIIPEYRPDLIIWGYVTNDPDEGLIPQISWSQQSLPGFNRIKGWAARIWPRLVAKFDALRSHKLAKAYTGLKYGYEYNEWELKLVEPTNLVAYEKTVRGVKALMDEHQLLGFMLTLPNFPSTKHFAPRLDPILPVWRDAGIPAHNTLPAFVAKYGEAEASGTETIQWGINPADGHPGPRACRFLAESAAQIIESQHKSVLGPEVISCFEDIVINDWLPQALDVQVTTNIDRIQVTAIDSRVAPDWLNWSWTLSYPSDESQFPFMPQGVPTAVIAIDTPYPMTELHLRGTSLKSGQAWIESPPSTPGYGHEWIDLGQTSGDGYLVWKLPVISRDQRRTVIRFHLNSLGRDRRLDLTLGFPNLRVEPKP